MIFGIKTKKDKKIEELLDVVKTQQKMIYEYKEFIRKNNPKCDFSSIKIEKFRGVNYIDKFLLRKDRFLEEDYAKRHLMEQFMEFLKPHILFQTVDTYDGGLKIIATAFIGVKKNK